jgi:hypothetical protein
MDYTYPQAVVQGATHYQIAARIAGSVSFQLPAVTLQAQLDSGPLAWAPDPTRRLNVEIRPNQIAMIDSDSRIIIMSRPVHITCPLR